MNIKKHDLPKLAKDQGQKRNEINSVNIYNFSFLFFSDKVKTPNSSQWRLNGRVKALQEFAWAVSSSNLSKAVVIKPVISIKSKMIMIILIALK